MTIHTVRSLIVQRTGLATTLIRQGLPDPAIAWMVGFVPECFSDASLLITLLSDVRKSAGMTAAERLCASNAALRISILHAGRDGVIVTTLAAAAMNVLVSFFYLVVGPVGVAVRMCWWWW